MGAAAHSGAVVVYIAYVTDWVDNVCLRTPLRVRDILADLCLCAVTKTTRRRSAHRTVTTWNIGRATESAIEETVASLDVTLADFCRCAVFKITRRRRARRTTLRTKQKWRAITAQEIVIIASLAVRLADLGIGAAWDTTRRRSAFWTRTTLYTRWAFKLAADELDVGASLLSRVILADRCLCAVTDITCGQSANWTGT